MLITAQVGYAEMSRRRLTHLRSCLAPAATGGGGEAGKAHTTEEWYRNTKGVEGVQRALYTLLLAAGVAG